MTRVGSGVSGLAARTIVVVLVSLLLTSASAGVGAPGAVLIPPAQASDLQSPEDVATSVHGRAIKAYRIGPGTGAVRLVIIGQLHGNEPAGAEVVAELLRTAAASSQALDLDLWLIESANPDGQVAASRVNARGVDLNRNFPSSWRRAGSGTKQWSGSTAASEPEVVGLMGFLTRVRPTAVIVLHQDYAVVDLTHERSRAAGRVLARMLRLPARPVGCSGRCHGTLTEWVDHDLGAIALTVELPGQVRGHQVRRYAAAIEDFALWLGHQAPH